MHTPPLNIAIYCYQGSAIFHKAEWNINSEVAINPIFNGGSVCNNYFIIILWCYNNANNDEQIRFFKCTLWYFESTKVAVELFLRYLADKGQARRFFTLLGKWFKRYVKTVLYMRKLGKWIRPSEYSKSSLLPNTSEIVQQLLF